MFLVAPPSLIQAALIWPFLHTTTKRSEHLGPSQAAQKENETTQERERDAGNAAAAAGDQRKSLESQSPAKC